MSLVSDDVNDDHTVHAFVDDFDEFCWTSLCSTSGSNLAIDAAKQSLAQYKDDLKQKMTQQMKGLVPPKLNTRTFKIWLKKYVNRSKINAGKLTESFAN